MQANKSTRQKDEINRLLVELGNAGGGLPFYAIFPGNGDPPITFDGLLSTKGVINRFEQAGLGGGMSKVSEVSGPAG